MLDGRMLRRLASILIIVSLCACSRSASVSQNSASSENSTNPVIEAAFSPEAERGGVVATPLDPRTLSPTELQFGRSPKPDPNVTYQPDVLIMEHGDTALRSMESNGLIWHFDANAPQVDQIEEGKLLFATERCVGRVLHVARTGDDVAVVLGPVQITDIIQKAHLVYDQPIDLNSIIVAPEPDLPVMFKKDVPGAASPSESPSAPPTVSPSVAPTATTTGEITRHFRLVSVTYSMVMKSGAWKPYRVVSYDKLGRPHQRFLRPMSERVAQAQPPALPGGVTTGTGAPPASIGVPSNLTVSGNVPAVPCFGTCGGWGVELTYDRDGLKVVASLALSLTNPRLRVNLPILNGLHRFAIELQGAGGFEAHMQLGADKSFNGNVHLTGNLPFDLSIPLVGPGLIGIHLIQSLNLSTGFSARTSYLEASLKLQVCCRLGVAYDGSWSPLGPKLVGTTNANVSGVSVGINSVVFGLRQEVLLGLGFDGLATGPYVALDTGISALKQSSAVRVLPLPDMRANNALDCRQATLNMKLDAGVGWTLPGVIVSIFNGFLKVVGAAPIPSSGSFVSLKPPLPLIDYKGSLPKGCAG